MRTRYWITVMRLLALSRSIAGHLGRSLKSVGRKLVLFSEFKESVWGTMVFRRLEFAEIEIFGFFSNVYRGPIYAARFQHCGKKGKTIVVLSLNWVATRREPLGGLSDASVPWIFGGISEIVVDPATSPLHELPDGSLWFMWSNGHYAVIRFDQTQHLRFAGAPDTPRRYEYF